MSAKEELMDSTVRVILESPTVRIEPPWMDSPCEFMRVHSWRESSFKLEIQTKETLPASCPAPEYPPGWRSRGR